MVGYIVKNKDYEIGGIYSDITIYDNPKNCFSIFDPDNKIFEVKILSPNEGQIIKELSWYEILDLVNKGKHNTGQLNYGDSNTGRQNYGSSNTGSKNDGYWNTGNANEGVLNSGRGNQGTSNTGSYNQGKYNSGNMNVGNFNSGDINVGNNICGVFNYKKEDDRIYMFNKLSHWTYQDWLDSRAARIISGNFMLNKWVNIHDMTPQERIDNPRYEELGGYLKTYSYKEAWQEMWSILSPNEKQSIISLPNFDKEVFYKITGVLL